MHYFVDVCRLLQFTAVLRLRCWDRMGRAERRRIARFEQRRAVAAGARGPRGARRARHRRPAAGDARRGMDAGPRASPGGGCSTATVRDRPVRGLRLDAVPPAALDPAPGARSDAEAPALQRAGRQGRAAGAADRGLGAAAHQRAAADDRPAALLRRLHREAQPRAATGPRRPARAAGDGRSGRAAAAGVAARSRGLQRARRRLRRARGRVRARGRASRSAADDTFVATTWWTAHIAHAAVTASGRERFLYLIQEYEPFTFPMGSYAALAAGSYGLPHTALFSTELLRGYFRAHGIGVYADGDEAGDRASARVRERDHRDRAAGGRRAARAASAPAAVLRAARAARRAEHVRARRARARAGRSPTARSTTAGRCTGSAPSSRRAAVPTSAAARRSSCCPGPPRPTTARCSATTTPASRSCTRRTRAWSRSRWPPRACSPSPTRSRTRRPSALAAISPNLIAGGPDRGGRRRARCARPRPRARRTPTRACGAARSAGAATGTRRSTRSCSDAWPAAAPMTGPPRRTRLRRRWRRRPATRASRSSTRSARSRSSRSSRSTPPSSAARSSARWSATPPCSWARSGRSSSSRSRASCSTALGRRPGGRRASGPRTARYARRRALRILPAYWVALTVLAIFPGIVGVFTADWWRYYLFLQAYDASTLPFGIPVAWTLCVEVAFYVSLPFWALAVRRIRLGAGPRAWLRSELAALAFVATAAVAVQVAASRQEISPLLAQTVLGQAVWLALGMALAVVSVAAGGPGRSAALTGAIGRRPGLCWLGAARGVRRAGGPAQRRRRAARARGGAHHAAARRPDARRHRADRGGRRAAARAGGVRRRRRAVSPAGSSLRRPWSGSASCRMASTSGT